MGKWPYPTTSLVYKCVVPKFEGKVENLVQNPNSKILLNEGCCVVCYNAICNDKNDILGSEIRIPS
jgi:hypothetical protein